MSATEERCRVLVVEDSMPIRRMLAKVLSTAGMDVTEAENGKHAMEVLSAEEVSSFSLLMVDLMMPVMDGTTFVKTAREEYGDQLPPVMIVSSRSDREAIQAVRDLGVSGYVLKPFKSETVLAKARDLIGQTLD